MAILSEVRFAHPDGALVDTLTARPDLDVAVVPDARTDPSQRFYVFRFEGADLDAVRGALAEDHTVAEVRPKPGFEDQRLLGVEFAPEATLLNPEVTDEGGLVLEAQSATAKADPRGWHERWLLPDDRALHDIWERALDAGFAFEVLDVHQRGRDGPEFAAANTLTEKQTEALIAAYEHGYFAEPRETSLEELADYLDLSPTAVGGRLRRGLKALIGQTLLTVDDQNSPPEND